MSGEAIRYLVEHETSYQYSTLVEFAHHIACLRPAVTERQSLLQFDLQITPEPGVAASRTDAFGNTLEYFSISVPHRELSVSGHSQVSLLPRAEPGAGLPLEEVRESLLYAKDAPYRPESALSFASPHVPLLAELRDYAAQDFEAGRPVIEAARALMRRVHEEFAYESGSTSVTTTVAESFAAKSGVCQDFSHVMLAGLRGLGLAARYVSGYLLTLPPEGQPHLVGADASHAWVSVWCPQEGWVDLAPTNDVLPDQQDITVAVGRDYGDIAPLKGVIRGGDAHQLKVGVTVTPVSES
ncbi:MAG: transglutaminase family protein [Candidatus Protistobacter heckmanni]|nr:transglutaminase family protein [Candidatus Protistobacter heckmanni]